MIQLQLNAKARSQRGAETWNAKLPDYVQCYYVSACVFLSNWFGNEAVSDDYYNAYVDDVEQLVGGKGIGEKIAAKLGLGPSVRTGAYAAVHQAAIQVRLPKKPVVFSQNLVYDDFKKHLDDGSPLITNTMLTHKGHVVTVVGHTDKGLLVIDPWGNAADGYKTTTPGPHEYTRELWDTKGRAADGKFWAIFIG